jgi:hypothetical protein
LDLYKSEQERSKRGGFMFYTINKNLYLGAALLLVLGVNVSFNPSRGQVQSLDFASQTPAAQDKELTLSCGRFAADYYQTGEDVVVRLEAIDGKPCEGRCGTKIIKEKKVSNLEDIRIALAKECESRLAPQKLEIAQVPEKKADSILGRIEQLEKKCKDKSGDSRLECHVGNLSEISEKLASEQDKDQREIVTKYYHKNIKQALSKMMTAIESDEISEENADQAKELIASLSGLDYNNGRDVQKHISALTLQKYKSALYKSSREHLLVNTNRYDNPYEQQRDKELAALTTARINSMFAGLGNTYFDTVRSNLMNFDDEKTMRKALKDLNLEYFRNQMLLTRNAFSPFIQREAQISNMLTGAQGEPTELEAISRIVTPDLFKQREAGRTNGVILPQYSPNQGYNSTLPTGARGAGRGAAIY